MSAISIMMKPASGLCNMHCSYCFYKDETIKREQENYGMMSIETLENILKRAFKKATSLTLAFQGGEPTLRGLDFFEQCIQLEKKYNSNNIPVYHAFQTNGYLIDEKWCEFFSKNHFLVGISIDGTKRIHDLYRTTNNGEGSYDRIKTATKLFDKYHVDYNILTVMNQDVAKNIREIYIEYKKNGWRYQQYIPCLDALEEQRGLRDYSLTPEVYGKALITLFKMWYKDVKRGNQPYIRTFENYIGILLGYPPESCDMNGTCGISYIIESNGDVYPCDFYMIDQYKLGNINEDPFIQLDLKRKEIGFIERSLKIEDKCKQCKYYRICRGGCQRHRDLNGENIYHNYFCDGYLGFFDECLDDLLDIIHMLKRRG